MFHYDIPEEKAACRTDPLYGRICYLRQQAKENITRYVDEKLPQAYEKCLVDLKQHLERSMNDVSKGIVNIQIRCK